MTNLKRIFYFLIPAVILSFFYIKYVNYRDSRKVSNDNLRRAQLFYDASPFFSEASALLKSQCLETSTGEVLGIMASGDGAAWVFEKERMSSWDCKTSNSSTPKYLNRIYDVTNGVYSEGAIAVRAVFSNEQNTWVRQTFQEN